MRIVAKFGSRRRSSIAVLVASAVLSAGLVGGLVPFLGASASAAPRTTPPVLQSISVPTYPGVLGNSKSFSLYLLHDEAGGKLLCTGPCLQFWFPLYVAKGSDPSVGAGVKGKVAIVARKLSSTVTKYQLTYNSYPVYVYSGDTGSKQSHGEHFKFATGDYWYLINASATTTAATPVTKSTPPVIRSINVPSYPGVLGNSKSFSLYLLQDEAGGKLLCTGPCLQFWFPLYVAKGSDPSVGAGVKGKVAMIARKLSSTVTKYQLTFNSYPVYVYSGDTGPKQSNGEHLMFAAGDYWYLINASATTAAATPVPPVSGGGW